MLGCGILICKLHRLTAPPLTSCKLNYQQKGMWGFLDQRNYQTCVRKECEFACERPLQARSPPRRCFCCLVTAERSASLLLSLHSCIGDPPQSLNNDFAVLFLNLCHRISKETKQIIRKFSSKNTLRDYPLLFKERYFFSSQCPLRNFHHPQILAITKL